MMMIITRGLGVSVRERGVHVRSATGDATISRRGDGSHSVKARVTAVKCNHIAQQLVHNWIVSVQQGLIRIVNVHLIFWIEICGK